MVHRLFVAIAIAAALATAGCRHGADVEGRYHRVDTAEFLAFKAKQQAEDPKFWAIFETGLLASELTVNANGTWQLNNAEGTKLDAGTFTISGDTLDFSSTNPNGPYHVWALKFDAAKNTLTAQDRTKDVGFDYVFQKQ